MRTTKDYKDYVLEQLKVLDNIVCRPMMGEYLLYCDSILFGGLYDNRLLIKKVESNKKYDLTEEIPYKGAKAMYYLDNLEDQEKVKEIILNTIKDLPKKKENVGRK